MIAPEPTAKAAARVFAMDAPGRVQVAVLAVEALVVITAREAAPLFVLMTAQVVALALVLEHVRAVLVRALETVLDVAAHV